MCVAFTINSWLARKLIFKNCYDGMSRNDQLLDTHLRLELGLVEFIISIHITTYIAYYFTESSSLK